MHATLSGGDGLDYRLDLDMTMPTCLYRRSEIRDKVLAALGQASVEEFRHEIEQDIDCLFEIRGANPVLVSLNESVRDLRLSALGLREAFWIKFVTRWTAEYEEVAEDQGPDALAHLWRGLMGQRLTPEQRPLVRDLARQAGVVEAAQAMCEAASASPDEAIETVFQDFVNRCRATISEREKQGLPAPVVKYNRRRGSIGSVNWVLRALGIGGRKIPTVEAFLRTFPGNAGNADPADEAEAEAVAPASRSCKRRSSVRSAGRIRRPSL